VWVAGGSDEEGEKEDDEATAEKFHVAWIPEEYHEEYRLIQNHLSCGMARIYSTSYIQAQTQLIR
jgi:hypothetical protein